jgi:hypothetical protein
MNNKIESISHGSFGFRSAAHFIVAIYHCCARLPPAEAARELYSHDGGNLFRKNSAGKLGL